MVTAAKGAALRRAEWMASTLLLAVVAVGPMACVPQPTPTPPQVSPLGPIQSDWRPGPNVVRRALEACDESVDSELELRGMPANPVPETPAFDVQLKLYRQCMMSRGFVPYDEDS